MLSKLALPFLAVAGLLFASTKKASAQTVAPVNEVVTVNNVAVDKSLPRGIRNNNPGNLVMTAIPWNGKVPSSKNTDGAYEQFTSAIYGIRAMFMDVRGDIEKDGKNTVRLLIYEYAPPHENNTVAYINSVCQKIGIGPDERIRPEHYFDLLKAIIYHENGQQPYSDALIQEAMDLA